ncbi:MAG TPA: energy transducer TonB [Candidatus Acidoferrum sp.]|nr:energy transducer TonB [Candidatus Acidoferrum sp.]
MQTACAASVAVPIDVIRRNELFSETLLEMSSTRPPRRATDLFMSMLIHVLVLVAVILPSLYFTDTIDLKKFTATFLVGPPPPPPPPIVQSVVKVVQAPRRVFMSQGKLLAPISIPQKIAMLREEPPAPDIGAGTEGGVPGGVPGGQFGGVIGGIISGVSHTLVPAPSAGPRAPMRVGGRIKPPRPVVQTAPIYPILAKQTMQQGIVTIDAVIDAKGNVVEMRVLSGPPLLIQGALDAVRQWKYEPTYLNDQAIPVQLIVKVTFQFQH